MSAPAARKELLARLRTNFDEVSKLEPARVAFSKAADSLVSEVHSPMLELLDDAVTALSELERHYAGDRDDDILEIEEFDWEATFELTPIPGEESEPTPPIRERLEVEIADTCFTALSELRRVRRQLDAPHDSTVELLSTCERARRKLRRSIGAVTDAATRAAGEPCSATRAVTADVESGLAVRAMYARFRRSLVECDETDPASIKRALRYAAVSLAIMNGSADFSEVRVADRRLILSLQERVLAWARNPAERDGPRLYKDICTAADLLRSINMRQELLAHDAAIVFEVRAALGGESQDDRALRELIGRLHSLHGRDDELDALVRDVLDGGAAADAVPAIRAALDRITLELPSGMHVVEQPPQPLSKGEDHGKDR